MKLGHYMKVPPRVMFFGQIIGSAVAATSQLAVHTWMFTNIECVHTSVDRSATNDRSVIETCALQNKQMGKGTARRQNVIAEWYNSLTCPATEVYHTSTIIVGIRLITFTNQLTWSSGEWSVLRGCSRRTPSTSMFSPSISLVHTQ